MFSNDVDNVRFTDKDAVVLEEDYSTDIIRIVFKRYEEDRLRLKCYDRDRKIRGAIKICETDISDQSGLITYLR